MSILEIENSPHSKLTPAERVERIDWNRMARDLAENGSAVAQHLLTPAECRELASLYAQPDRFRSRVVMARYAFGKGEYQYFRYPLPAMVAELRTALYRYIAPIANDWNARMRINRRSTQNTWLSVTVPDNGGPRHYCCNMATVIIAACIKISMAISRFRCRL